MELHRRTLESIISKGKTIATFIMLFTIMVNIPTLFTLRQNDQIAFADDTDNNNSFDNVFNSFDNGTDTTSTINSNDNVEQVNTDDNTDDNPDNNFEQDTDTTSTINPDSNADQTNPDNNARDNQDSTTFESINGTGEGNSNDQFISTHNKDAASIFADKTSKFNKLSTVHIDITEAYANEATDRNGNHYQHTRLNQGDIVHKPQTLQFREDLSPGAKIISADCAIDDIHIYQKECDFSGKSASWILNEGIQTGGLSPGEHTYSVQITVEDPLTQTQISSNIAKFRFVVEGIGRVNVNINEEGNIPLKDITVYFCLDDNCNERSQSQPANTPDIHFTASDGDKYQMYTKALIYDLNILKGPGCSGTVDASIDITCKGTTYYLDFSGDQHEKGVNE